MAATEQATLADAFEADENAGPFPENAAELCAHLGDDARHRRLKLGIPLADIPTQPRDPDADPIGRSGKRTLKNYASIAARLPEPGVVFQLGDRQFDFSEGEIRKLRDTGHGGDNLILKVGTVCRCESQKEVNVYATNPVAWVWMQEFASDQPTFECCWKGTGHENPRDIDGYRCSDCGAPKTREQVEEVFF